MFKDILFESYPNRVWKSPSDYSGHDPVGELVVAVRNRDSGFMENFNYCVALSKLNDISHSLGLSLQDNKFAYDWRARHWAVGWVEYLMVSPEAPEELHKEALNILNTIDEESVLGLDEYVRERDEAAKEIWDGLDDYDKDHVIESVKSENPSSVDDEIQDLALMYVVENYLVE